MKIVKSILDVPQAIEDIKKIAKETKTLTNYIGVFYHLNKVKEFMNIDKEKADEHF